MSLIDIKFDHIRATKFWEVSEMWIELEYKGWPIDFDFRTGE